MKKEILLKRNELKHKSVHLRNIKFDESLKDKDIANLLKEQNNMYNKWKFYDGIIKAMNKKEN